MSEEGMTAVGQEQALILGELRGQVKELIHSINNLQGKVDVVGKEVMAIGFLAKDISDLKTRAALLETRMATQEANGNQLSGARQVIEVIMKSPLIGWVLGAAALLYVAMKKGAV